MQVWLPAATKADRGELGAAVKESGLFSGASHLEGGGLTSHSPSPPLCVGRGFYRGEGDRTRRPREGLQSSLCADDTVYSDKTSDGAVRHPGLVTLASRHLSFMSS